MDEDTQNWETQEIIQSDMSVQTIFSYKLKIS